VFLAAGHDRRRDAAGAGPPRPDSGPSARVHEVVRAGRPPGWCRPPEPGRPGFPDRHEYESRPKLGDLVHAGLDEVPPRPVAEVVQVFQHLRPVAIEPAGRQASDILEQDRAQAGFPDQLQGPGEQVALVGLAELLSVMENGGHGSPPANRSMPVSACPSRA
jgi:hypothetical protein